MFPLAPYLLLIPAPFICPIWTSAFVISLKNSHFQKQSWLFYTRRASRTFLMELMNKFLLFYGEVPTIIWRYDSTTKHLISIPVFFFHSLFLKVYTHTTYTRKNFLAACIWHMSFLRTDWTYNNSKRPLLLAMDAFPWSPVPAKFVNVCNEASLCHT